jgi:hypothetical protein
MKPARRPVLRVQTMLKTILITVGVSAVVTTGLLVAHNKVPAFRQALGAAA